MDEALKNPENVLVENADVPTKPRVKRTRKAVTVKPTEETNTSSTNVEVETVKEALKQTVKGRQITDIEIRYEPMIKNMTANEFKKSLMNQTIHSPTI